MPTLYGAPLSPFVRKVAIFLEEKGVAYEWKMVRPHDRDEAFKGLSPLGKIPAYKDDKTGLCDSSVICFYLERTYPDPALYPSDTVELARAMWFEEYFDGAMIKPMSDIYFHSYFNPRFLAKPTDEAVLADAQAKLPPLLDYIEAQLKPGEWMVENRFSIADIALGTGFANIALAGVKPDRTRNPKLAVYIERLYKRPSFVKIVGAMDAFIPTIKVKNP